MCDVRVVVCGLRVDLARRVCHDMGKDGGDRAPIDHAAGAKDAPTIIVARRRDCWKPEAPYARERR